MRIKNSASLRWRMKIFQLDNDSKRKEGCIMDSNKRISDANVITEKFMVSILIESRYTYTGDDIGVSSHN